MTRWAVAILLLIAILLLASCTRTEPARVRYPNPAHLVRIPPSTVLARNHDARISRRSGGT